MGKTLFAPKGFIYTDGETTYGYQIHVGDGVNESKYYLITDEKYREILAEEEQKMLAEML